MKKRIIAIVLAGCMLCGCGSTQTKEDDKAAETEAQFSIDKTGMSIPATIKDFDDNLMNYYTNKGWEIGYAGGYIMMKGDTYIYLVQGGMANDDISITEVKAGKGDDPMSGQNQFDFSPYTPEYLEEVQYIIDYVQDNYID